MKRQNLEDPTRGMLEHFINHSVAFSITALKARLNKSMSVSEMTQPHQTSKLE